MTPSLHRLLSFVATVGAPVRPCKRSDAFADLPVTDQSGRQFLFRSELVANRAVVINTMYTVCRGSCPGTSSTLRSLRSEVAKTFGSRVSFLSLTIDPANDTPERMLAYASLYGAKNPEKSGHPSWHFLTGSVETIEALRRSLGFFDLNPKLDADPAQHASFLLFGNDRTNRWATSPSNLREGLIIEPLRRILGETRLERFGI